MLLLSEQLGVLQHEAGEGPLRGELSPLARQ